MSDKSRVLIAEQNRAIASTLRKYLEGAGFEAEATETADDALNKMKDFAPDVLLAGMVGLDGEELCRKVKELAPTVQVVLFYPPEDDDPDQRAAAAGADSYLIGPIKRGNLVSCIKGMLRIRALSLQIASLEKALDTRGAGAPKASAEAEAEKTEAQIDFDFFKRLLLMEVKRSRRYRYPLAFLLVAVDRFREATANLDPRAQARYMGQLIGLAVKSVRDIDLCVLYAEDKFLVFLPHTPFKGAQLVGGRLRDRLAALEGDGPRVTVSVGIASYDGGGGNVSFGGLLKDATAALKKAQAEGGNRVESVSVAPKPKERVSIG